MKLLEFIQFATDTGANQFINRNLTAFRMNIIRPYKNGQSYVCFARCRNGIFELREGSPSKHRIVNTFSSLLEADKAFTEFYKPRTQKLK